jgi:hypothetical protein
MPAVSGRFRCGAVRINDELVEIATRVGAGTFVLVKQRLLSANKQGGNYVVTAALAAQLPVGAAPFTGRPR